MKKQTGCPSSLGQWFTQDRNDAQKEQRNVTTACCDDLQMEYIQHHLVQLPINK